MSEMRCAALMSLMLLVSSAVATGQTSKPASRPADEANPAAEGFDAEGSDAKAIAIADSVMEKMGGRAAWDDTRYVAWKFFGFRMHYWDKHTGDIRVEFTSREGVLHVLLTNLHTREGKAWVGGMPVTDAEELAGLMDNAVSAWINDSYWLVMPYKLKDSGVTLTYVGEEKMEDGRDADVLQLVFKDVGDTPQNKYHVFVARDSGLVEQWTFFRSAEDAEGAITSAWHNWQKYGNIMLSDDRGVMRGNPAKHTDVAVYDKLPRSVFESNAPVNLDDEGKETSMNTPLDKLAPLLGSWQGTFSIHDADEAVTDSFGIRWVSTEAFEGRYLRFEFSSLEPRSYGYAEFEGLFTPAEDGESIETVWVNPLIRKQTDRFVSSQTLFMEQGTFDSTGTVLTLFSKHQYGPEEPVIRYKSVFTLAGPDRFTVVDFAFDEEADAWTKKYTFDLKRN